MLYMLRTYSTFTYTLTYIYVYTHTFMYVLCIATRQTKYVRTYNCPLHHILTAITIILLDYCASPCQASSSSPHPGIYICGVLDNGCIIYRDITSKEGFQVSDSPMSTSELRKNSSKCMYVVCLYGSVN